MELRREFRVALEQIAPGARFDAHVFTPEIEVVFFEAPEALAELVGRTLSDAELSTGLTSPKDTLAGLIPDVKRLDLSGAIDAPLARAFREGPQMNLLFHRLQALVSQAVSVGAVAA